MAKKCNCPKYFKHEPLIGKEKTAQAAEMSRLALISKMKETGMKHRIIIDLRRSKGNDRCTVNERIVLPRMVDVIKGIQDLWRNRGEAGGKPDFQIELMGCDLADAYCHFGVTAEEIKRLMVRVSYCARPCCSALRPRP